MKITKNQLRKLIREQVESARQDRWPDLQSGVEQLQQLLAKYFEPEGYGHGSYDPLGLLDQSDDPWGRMRSARQALLADPGFASVKQKLVGLNLRAYEWSGTISKIDLPEGEHEADSAAYLEVADSSGRVITNIMIEHDYWYPQDILAVA